MKITLADLEPRIRERALEYAKRFSDQPDEVLLQKTLSNSFAWADTPEKHNPWERIGYSKTEEEFHVAQRDFIEKFIAGTTEPSPPTPGNRTGGYYRLLCDTDSIGNTGDTVVLCYDDSSNQPGFCRLEDYTRPLISSEFHSLSKRRKAFYIKMSRVELLSSKVQDSIDATKPDETLKVGDYVEYYRHGSTADWAGIQNSRVSENDSFLGKKGLVDDVCKKGVRFKHDGYRFPPQCFRKVSKDKPAPLVVPDEPVKKSRVGKYYKVKTSTRFEVPQGSIIVMMEDDGTCLPYFCLAANYTVGMKYDDKCFCYKMSYLEPFVVPAYSELQPESVSRLFTPRWMCWSRDMLMSGYEFVTSISGDKYTYSHRTQDFKTVFNCNTETDSDYGKQLTELLPNELMVMRREAFHLYSPTKFGELEDTIKRTSINVNIEFPTTPAMASSSFPSRQEDITQLPTPIIKSYNLNFTSSED